MTLLTILALLTVHLSVDQTSVDVVQWHNYDGKVICYTPIQLFDFHSRGTSVTDDSLQHLWPTKLNLLSFPSDKTYRRIQNIVLIHQSNMKNINTLMTFQQLTAKERRKLWKNFRNWKVKKDKIKSKRREDDRTRIEAHLLMAGVEQNPGPIGEQTVKLTRYTRWDRELSTWLITYCETMENQLKNRVSLLLSYLDPTATGTKAIYPLVIRILGLSANELKEKYFQNQPDVTEQTIHARLDDHRWNVIISQLNKLLPSLSAEQPEQMLKK